MILNLMLAENNTKAICSCEPERSQPRASDSGRTICSRYVDLDGGWPSAHHMHVLLGDRVRNHGSRRGSG